ncbi:MAG: hypothetical protein Harvfovirus3_31 [Harvfovirus sp.]|uniref:Uncharacterized protein n=1 Tax=Harvfovirus sp. TaxID=2487768 RepID=A0A3G5A030_9VIRU|nr:MAG: hypothetical protein Harvfovirus3_31 [Harvfovirus sp.]
MSCRINFDEDSELYLWTFQKCDKYNNIYKEINRISINDI